MYKAILIALLGFTCFSFLDGLDTFSVYLNHKEVGHCNETEYGKSFYINANLDKDTLIMFRYLTDYGGEMDSRIELRAINDSIIHFAAGSYWSDHGGTFIFPILWVKNEIESHKEMKVYIIQKHSDYRDTATYKNKQFIGYLKFE